MKKLSKHLISFAIITFLVLPVFALPALAQTNDTDPINGTFGLTPVNEGLGGVLNQDDPRTMVGRIINMALGFLGVIAVVIILAGGFKWMTAGGNEEKVAEARKMLGYGVIGLVIIFAAWAVATFVIGSIYNSTIPVSNV